MKKSILIGLCAGFLFACQSEPEDAWKATDLLPYGLPVTIQAPDSAEIEKRTLAGSIQDVTVRAGDDYYVQIYASEAETNDISKIKANQIAEVKGHRYFSRIVREEEQGFLYETRIDTTNTSYGFRYIRLQGDQELIFQTGLSGLFTLEEAEAMYEAVKNRKTE